MNHSWRVHYMNKYPGAKVFESLSSFDVYSADGVHVVSMLKNGAGQWVDVSEELGLEGKHDLAPIPRDARVHKVKDGKIGLDEKHQERVKARDDFRDESGKIKSIADLKKEGFEFDSYGDVRSRK